MGKEGGVTVWVETVDVEWELDNYLNIGGGTLRKNTSKEKHVGEKGRGSR